MTYTNWKSGYDNAGTIVYGLTFKYNRPKMTEKVKCLAITSLLLDYIIERNYDVREIPQDVFWQLPNALKRDLCTVDDYLTWIKFGGFKSPKQKAFLKTDTERILGQMKEFDTFSQAYTPQTEEEAWTYRPITPPPLDPKN